jgi:hypothetical protein
LKPGLLTVVGDLVLRPLARTRLKAAENLLIMKVSFHGEAKR